MYNFSKNTVSYCFLQNKKLFNLILTASKGWGILVLKQDFFLIKEKEIYPFVLNEKSSLSFTKNVFLGFYKGYLQYLKLKGMGYKFIKTKYDTLTLKLGFSHRIIFVNYTNVYCKYMTKYITCFQSRSLVTLKKINQLFFKIKKNNVYKKKGIFLKGSLINLKVSSKKSKF